MGAGNTNLHLIIPTGTQVVTGIDFKDKEGRVVIPKGSVGTIIASPTDNFHSYRVRFPDGKEGNFGRRELAIRKHFQKEGLDPQAAEYDFTRHIVYRCIVGSRAYGLDHEGSDTDRRGIYLPPAEIHWSLYGVPEQLENKDNEECYWEMQKFLILALKANPNVLECLYSPMVETAEPIARELLAIRDVFLSQLVYQTYNGYVLSQFKKMEQDIRVKGGIKWKHAMHLIRLLLSGATTLEQGFVPIDVGPHRDALLEIRQGLWTWEKVDAWRLDLHRKFEQAFAETRLPERPDYERANTFLIEARKHALENKP
jgi:predicted nucleotidyltransferase